MTRHRCVRESLAKGKSSNVERCSCGHLHVTVGPITMRVDEATLGDLAGVLERALRAMERERGREGTAWRDHDAGLA